MAATPARSVTKFPLALSRPSFPPVPSVSPSSRSLPTRTSVRKSSPVGEECRPILRNGLDCSSPGMPRSRMKVSTGRWRSGVSLPSSSLA